MGRQVLIVGCSLVATALLAVVAVFSISHPWLILIPGGFFAALYSVSRKKALVLATGAWFCYLPYEWGMKLRILCSGECNIRVDLLVVLPMLLVLSIAGFMVFFRERLIVKR